MSQATLSTEQTTYATCVHCYKKETKNHKFQRCGRCQKARYCSKECQKNGWPDHKQICKQQAENREARPAKGTAERDVLVDIKKWFSKHTQLLLYVGTHAMQLHDLSQTSMLKTHMLVIQLQLDTAPAPNATAARGKFTFKSVAVREMRECGLDDAMCTALAQRAITAERDRRHSLTMYVACGPAAYFAPITIPRCESALEHRLRWGPPDGDWAGFLQRAVNDTLEEEDRTRIKRLKEMV